MGEGARRGICIEHFWKEESGKYGESFAALVGWIDGWMVVGWGNGMRGGDGDEDGRVWDGEDEMGKRRNGSIFLNCERSGNQGG